MLKKILPQVIPNTIIFVLVTIFITLFNSIFGDANSLVGVTIVVTSLILMKKDLTRDPIKYFFKLLIINLSMGIISSVSSGNMWLGIVLNFLALGSIGYFLTKDLTKGLVLPYGLQYLLMLYKPVQGIDFQNRIIALIFGAVFVMALQYIIYFAKKKSNSNKIDEGNQELENNIYAKRYSNDEYRQVKLFGKDININKTRALYAIKVGILTSLTAFITYYFEIAQGAWMTYTIFSLTEIYSEDTEIRTKKRIEGTIIGALIVVVSFFIFKDEASRTLIILLAGYLNAYFKDYKHVIIIVTVTAVAPVALEQGSINIAVQRILFVIIGAILSSIVNKLIYVAKPNKNKSIEKTVV